MYFYRAVCLLFLILLFLALGSSMASTAAAAEPVAPSSSTPATAFSIVLEWRCGSCRTPSMPAVDVGFAVAGIDLRLRFCGLPARVLTRSEPYKINELPTTR